jgi:hypothetical protein
VGLLEEMEAAASPCAATRPTRARLDKLQLGSRTSPAGSRGKYFAEKTFRATKNYQTRLEEMEKHGAWAKAEVERKVGGGGSAGRGKAPVIAAPPARQGSSGEVEPARKPWRTG